MLIDDKAEVPPCGSQWANMTLDEKIRIVTVLVPVAISVAAAIAAVHGIPVGPLDEIGRTGH